MVERQGKHLLSDPGFELQLRGRQQRRPETINSIKNNNMCYIYKHKCTVKSVVDSCYDGCHD